MGLTEQEFGRHMRGNVLPRQPKPPASLTVLSNTMQRFDRAFLALDSVVKGYQDHLKDIESIEQRISTQVSSLL